MARVTSLELKASDIRITLCNLLASSKKHGHSLTHSEEDELYMCMDFLDRWMPRVTSSILHDAFEKDVYDNAIEEWADKLDTKLRNLVKDILNISSSTASPAAASPALPPAASVSSIATHGLQQSLDAGLGLQQAPPDEAATSIQTRQPSAPSLKMRLPPSPARSH